MKTISFAILGIFLVGSNGLPQIAPTGDTPPFPTGTSSELASPVPLPLSPLLSQWLSLVVPPIASTLPGGGKKKKKLLPGPPPPEGTPEPPFVTWTRMKLASVLAPPAPSPVQSADSIGIPSATNASTPEASVWAQWTQMKLPMTNPLNPSPGVGTPWDAWTNLKSPVAAPQPESTVSKRTAPEPYVTSTMTPEFATGIPGPVLKEILAVASPEEIKQLVELFEKLEALPPAEKQLLSKLQVETLLPSSLLPKLSPSLSPLLQKEIGIPIPQKVNGLEDIPPSVVPVTPEVISKLPTTMKPLLETLPPTIQPGVAPSTVPSSIPPVPLTLIPEPVLSAILAVATPPELAELESTISKLEALPVEQKTWISDLELETLLPPTLLARLPPALQHLLETKVVIPPAPIPSAVVPENTPPTSSIIPPPVMGSAAVEAPPSPAEDKLLTKWAKIILEKTGRPVKAGVAPTEQVPPIQAAWTEWIQLQLNETEKPVAPASSTTPVFAATPSPPPAEESTSVNWTKWLKLKENTTTPTPVAPASSVAVLPGLDVTTESPEKSLLEWLQKGEQKTGEQPPLPEETAINPETEAKVVQLLKQYGLENVPLTPEQVKELLAAVDTSGEKQEAPVQSVTAAVPPVSTTPSAVHPPPPQYNPAGYPLGYPYVPLATKPIMRFWPPPMMNPYLPYMGPMNPYITPGPPVAPPAKLAPNAPQVSPQTTPLSIPNLAKVLEEQAENGVEPEVGGTTPPPSITAGELESLTPTKFTALLKEILKDCNKANILVSRSAKGGWDAGAGRLGRALLPIPLQQDSPASAPPSNVLPLPILTMPKVETSGTVLDPAYWAAQKSFFLSKLFSNMAKVALGDSSQTVTTTPSPAEQLVNQMNTVLLGDKTRSVKHQPEDYEQDGEEEDEENGEEEVDENELATNDNSEPNLPKEPDNPLHKLFKFGIQKSILSDLSTPAPASPTPAPVYIYYTTPESTTPSLDKQREMVERLQQVYKHNKMESRKKSKLHQIHKPNKVSKNSKPSPKHHPGPHRFRKSTTSATTTDNTVDFDLLAKALLLDDKTKK